MLISFEFPSFSTNNTNLTLQGDAFTNSDGLKLTKDSRLGFINSSVGRALYHERVHLWDNSTGKPKVIDFTTHFSFIITPVDKSSADGLAFFITPFNSIIPNNSAGGLLGLFSKESVINGTQNQIVAVEFDTYQNPWDPSDNHVGIDVDSRQMQLCKQALRTGQRRMHGLSYIVDLKTFLPEWVSVGFSGATGVVTELHTILSWSFSSTLDDGDGFPQPNKTGDGLTQTNNTGSGSRKSKLGLIIDVAVSSGVVSCAIGTGPRRFTYQELIRATNNFTEGGKLGEGGFGGVYKGLLSESNIVVAVKKVSKGSKQGKKEYISEVTIISRLRHKNLVQLIGWCHEQRELLLVYEYMSNGSLDSHLFAAKISLTWPIRYKIAQGLASALLYLHEEWEQCVVHRDIKSSNIMSDSNFNAKLGDFGLAKLVDHELNSQTTVLAGTMGYLAQECFTTGKASKESAVYSFGGFVLKLLVKESQSSHMHNQARLGY
ncbi:hypothetical protein ACB094_03G077200 [Castanea mollissima]